MKQNETEDTRPVVVRKAANGNASQTGSGRSSKIIALILVIAILASSGGAVGGYLAGRFQPALTPVSRSNVDDGNKIVTQEEEDIAGVASKVGPSVVSVLTRGESRSPFGTSTLEGAGTGIIVSKDGYILTNKHVIQDSQAVRVVSSSGVTYKNVKVIGVDPLNDIAFLKIEGVNDLRPAELGDSTSIRIGQKVVAIGNALGQYDNTVTSGIISGTGRSVQASLDGTSQSQSETLTDLIQVDAPINSGNSGGPLVNIAGQVIGVNTALASDANSIGFSISINAVKGMLKSLLKTGKIERAYIGVNFVAITPSVAEQYSLPVKKGAYVLANGNSPAVVSGSPAAQAGIKDKDIIIKVGENEIGDKGNVSTLIGAFAPGDTVELTILRDGKTITTRVTLAAYQA